MTTSAYPADTADEPVSLSAGQTKFLYWFVGTVPIFKALTPISTHLGNLWSGLGNDEVQKAKKLGLKAERKAIIKQAADLYGHVISDVSRQTATCSLQLISYFVVGDIIKAAIQKHYAKKPPPLKDSGQQQVITQVVPLLAQVVATIMSRWLGASQLQKALKRLTDASTETIPANEKFRLKINQFINTHLRDPETLALRPLKASFIGTGAMTVYFGLLIGGLYGLSTLLEKVLPEDYKPKKGKAKPVAPAPLNANTPIPSPSALNWLSSGPSSLINPSPVMPAYPAQPMWRPAGPQPVGPGVTL